MIFTYTPIFGLSRVSPWDFLIPGFRREILEMGSELKVVYNRKTVGVENTLYAARFLAHSSGRYRGCFGTPMVANANIG